MQLIPSLSMILFYLISNNNQNILKTSTQKQVWNRNRRKIVKFTFDIISASYRDQKLHFIVGHVYFHFAVAPETFAANFTHKRPRLSARAFIINETVFTRKTLQTSTVLQLLFIESLLPLLYVSIVFFNALLWPKALLQTSHASGNDVCNC